MIKKTMKRVAFTTLGCKVNQYDTDAMRGLFIKNNYNVVDFNDEADIYVINTCSVTNMGEKKSRQLIRQAHRQNKNATIIVTGCYAQLNPDAIAAIEGVNLVIGTNDRHKIVELYESLESTEKQINAVRNIMEQADFEEMPLIGNEINKSRAFMKIQEGCNNYCTFCIIPYTRGKLKSRKLPDIVQEAKRLVDFGYKEIVLTGIHLGNYGVDFKDGTSLAKVIKELLPIEGLERIRLGSIESVEVSEELIELFINNEKLCPHLHLPLQSGSEAILKGMNRHYTLKEFKDLVNNLRSKIKNLAITTDVIVGFPGEGDVEFNECVDTIKELGFTHIHVFPYSKREGTPAAKMDNQVPEAIKKTRVSLLNNLANESLNKFIDSLVNTEVNILLESENDVYLEGFTEHYIRAKIKDNGLYKVGEIVKAVVKTHENGIILAEIV